jgi:lipoyl(octanoyl) transferase
VEWLGRHAYGEALDRPMVAVEAAVALRERGETGDRLLLLEHPPVITLGRSARPENLLASSDELKSRGVELHHIQRGGDITYHAPGQLVGYLVCDLLQFGPPDVHRFLRGVEAALIETLAVFGIGSHRIDGMTGVYVDPPGLDPKRKIASIGVGVKQWVTYHGFALNVDLDLRGFDLIVPCGLEGVVMTSVAEEAGPQDAGLLARTVDVAAECFRKQFEISA